MTNEWKTSRDIPLVVLSATQVETWNLCKRKWWLSHVRRLPRVQTASQAFGTVLHAVCERFLNADDRGYDRQTGKPVDLYPEGWHIARSRFSTEPEGECDSAEQEIIKRLVSRAIDEGILERRPGRMVEREFRRTIIHLGCPDCEGDSCPRCKGEGKGTHFQITGFIDLCYPNEVQDHKTTKAIRWAKSKEQLRKNPQMLIYAKMLLEDIREQGGSPPDEIILRHNVYVKDPDDLRIRRTEVAVSIEEIEDHWRTVQACAEEMDRFRRTADVWTDLPDPSNPSDACNAYGGCEYRSICSGKESEENYELRLDEHKRKAYTLPLTQDAPENQKDATMNFAAKLAEKKAAMAQSAQPKSILTNPLALKAPVPSVPAAVPEERTVQVGRFKCRVWGKAADGTDLLYPPWSMPGVSVNGGIGFNQHGDPDRVSAIKAKAAGLPTPDLFDLTPIGDGTVHWQGKEGTIAEGMRGLSPLTPDYQPGEEIKCEEKVELKAAVSPPPVLEVPGAGEAADAEEDQENTDTAQAAAVSGVRGRGRPRRGFTLIINGVVAGSQEKPGSGWHVYDLHTVIQRIGEAMAREAGVSSFYELDAFSRRDALAAKAESLAKEVFLNDIVSACGVGPGMSDIKALCDALRPFAYKVIVMNAY